MVQDWGARKVPRLAPCRARWGLAVLAECEQPPMDADEQGWEGTRIEKLRSESGRDGERPTRSRVAGSINSVNKKAC